MHSDFLRFALKTAAALLITVFLLTLFPAGALAEPSGGTGSESQGRVITADCTIRAGTETIPEKLTDDDEGTYLKYPSGVTFTVQANEPIGGIYVKFDRTPPLWTLRYDGSEETCGEEGFLHENRKIYGNFTDEVTLKFTSEVSICDLFVLSRGQAPSFVQIWSPAQGRADILMMPAHSDDDQLFFAGSAPDAVARGAEMQVCYFTNHWNSHKRPHELLNGLWTCGITRYPVIGKLPDLWSDSEESGLAAWELQGFTYDDMVEMQVELLRRFKPQIVLGHDQNGEYGHGAHRLDSHSLRDAVLAAGDSTKYPESATRYGVWDTPKTYIHLWKENQIDFEIDEPLDYFGGKTAYQVSQQAFLCHISQLSTRYKTWLLGTEDAPVTKASQFYKYGPRSYGLWRSTVGQDIEKKDFYENITLYRLQELDALKLLQESEERYKQTEREHFQKLEALLDRANSKLTVLVVISASVSLLSVMASVATLIVFLHRRKRYERTKREE